MLFAISLQIACPTFHLITNFLVVHDGNLGFEKLLVSSGVLCGGSGSFGLFSAQLGLWQILRDGI